MKRMKEKSGVVTGGASGVGKAVARLFVSEGARVIVADLDAEGAAAVAAEIGPESARGIACDVTKEADVVAAIAACEDSFGGLDFMINNAGLQIEKTLDESTGEDFDQLFDVNVRAIFWGCKHGVAAMRGRGGTIVNTASALSLVSDPVLALYTASKHAALGLTRSVGVAYAEEGIRCNCVCPGDVETPMVERYWQATGDAEKAKRETAAIYPGKRIGRPEEVAEAILFLAGEESSFVNASYLQVDGGLLSKVY